MKDCKEKEVIINRDMAAWEHIIIKCYSDHRIYSVHINIHTAFLGLVKRNVAHDSRQYMQSIEIYREERIDLASNTDTFENSYLCHWVI